MEATLTTTAGMGRKKKDSPPSPPQQADEPDKKTENRSPSWAIYARIDLDLKGIFEEYQKQFEYEPELARVIEKALKRLFSDAGLYPPRKKNSH